MNEGYAYTTVKKVHNVLNEYFRYLTHQEYINRNPMISAPMIKKATFWRLRTKKIFHERNYNCVHAGRD